MTTVNFAEAGTNLYRSIEDTPVCHQPMPDTGNPGNAVSPNTLKGGQGGANQSQRMHGRALGALRPKQIGDGNVATHQTVLK